MENFVPLSALRSDAEMKADPFFAEMVARNTLPDGGDANPGLYRRLQNEHCLKCQEEYKKKYPEQAFKPNCQGIYDETDYREFSEETGLTFEEAAEYFDAEIWAESYIVIADKDGNFQPFSTKDREYQIPVLRCTSQYQVDRMARGLGKTSIGVITELHKTCNNKNYEVLVLCPAKAQAQMWYEEINKQFENSPMLRGALKRSVQAPYFMFVLHNGSKIKIFTAGSKAGRGADAIRGQSPRRVRLDEQDYLVDADYNAITALLRRFPDSEFHGSSTPTGARSMYWSMCTQMPEYKEFYVPVTVKKGWNSEQELILRREAKTADRYNHEYMALFGDLEQGVFKGLLVDQAKKHYTYAKVFYAPGEMGIREVEWNDCPYDPSRNYVLGCDWNGRGTGTRIRITEYNPITKVRRVVYNETIDSDTATTTISLEHIKLLNRLFHCDYIFCDKGFGFAQDELMRQMGVKTYPGYIDQDEKLLKATFVGSKENLSTNRLVPKRDPNSPYVDDKDLERQTKPFMVEGCQIAMEQLKVEFSYDDEVLEAQMRDYRVKTYSQNGQANTYEAKTEGDHDLDAWILSMLGIELNYGLFFDAQAHIRLAQISHVASFGSGIADKIASARARLASAAIPSRSMSTEQKQDDWNVAFSGREGAVVVPKNAPSISAVGGFGSRTASFRSGSRTGYAGSHTPRSGVNGPPSRSSFGSAGLLGLPGQSGARRRF